MKKESSTPVNGRDKVAEKDTTALDKLKKLREQAAKLETEVKNGLLEEASSAVKQLGELGFAYHLLSDEEYQQLHFKLTPPPEKKRGRPAGATNKSKDESAGTSFAKYDPAKVCAKCGVYGHHIRAHNLAEGFKDIPFTEDELKKRGYFPPDGLLKRAGEATQ